MPTTEELEEFYESQANPRPGDGWTPSNQHIDTRFGRTRFALEHIEAGDSVLEVGVQDGGMSRHLIAETGLGGHYTGIDIAPTYVERTKVYLVNLGLLNENVELHVADANTFSTRRRYDVIVAMEIMEHVVDPRQLMRNLWGLLRKNSGKIILTVPKDWIDSEGEHLHNFRESDVVQIVGEATGIRPPVWQEGSWIFTVVDKSGVPYEP